jgi:glycosyltransferase involved in cell wall biosynthesis
VPDLSHLYNQVRVGIAPLRFGAGLKGKVLEAMAYGVPMVASSIAIEGVPAESGQDVWVADEPDTFADAVARLHENEELWTRMAERGKNLVAGHFSPKAVERQLAEAFATARR